MADKNCEFTFESEIGEVTLHHETPMTYEESASVCEKNCAVLAPVHEPRVIKRISEGIRNCADELKNSTSDEDDWRVGFQVSFA